MSQRTRVTSALVAGEDGIYQPVVIRFRWAEPEQAPNGRWHQYLWCWDEETGSEADVGYIDLRWRLWFFWPRLLDYGRKMAENDVLQMLEDAPSEIEER